MSEDKVVLVTGASGHLGSAIARASAEAGWAVAVHYRSSEQAATQLVSEITDRGGSAHSFGADLGSDAEPARALVKAVNAHFGRLDALVNNSADQSPTPLPQLTDSQWQDMLAATFLSAANLTQAAAEAMEPGAAVVNITSVEASSAFPNHAHYAAAKAALESFTRSLALDFGPRGMRANAVAPGLIDRVGLADAWPQGLTWWQASSPSGRPVSAGEVAEAVVFLMGERASGINGVVLPVDGGWSASARAPF